MNIDRDKLIEMAKESKLVTEWFSDGKPFNVNEKSLLDFATLVSAHAITSMQTEQPKDEIAWLIELPLGYGTGNWLKANGTFGTVNEAVRFSRKEDAEQIIKNYLCVFHDSDMTKNVLDKLIATEHMWCQPSPAPVTSMQTEQPLTREEITAIAEKAGAYVRGDHPQLIEGNHQVKVFEYTEKVIELVKGKVIELVKCSNSFQRIAQEQADYISKLVLEKRYMNNTMFDKLDAILDKAIARKETGTALADVLILRNQFIDDEITLHPAPSTVTSMQGDSELVAVIERNLSGQVSIKDANGNAFDMGKYVGARLYLQSEMVKGDSEPVAWQFFQDGEWFIGSNKNNHKQNTIDGGFLVRDLVVADRVKCVSDEYYKVTQGFNTLYSGKDKSYAIEKAEKLTAKEPQVACSVTSNNVIWSNEAHNQLKSMINAISQDKGESV